MKTSNLNLAELAFWKPIAKAFGFLSALLVALLIVGGGVAFWAPEVAGFFFGRTSQPDEYELAQSGLRTMKRMVSDEQAWSLTIQQEYNQLFAGQANPLLVNNSRSNQSIAAQSNYQTNFAQAGRPLSH